MLGKLEARHFPLNLVEQARTIANRLAGKNPKRQESTELANDSNAQRSEATDLSDPAPINDLCDILTSLQSMMPQKRGFAFEKLLNKLFEYFLLGPRNSFRLVGEQIDGSFQLGQDIYLVEAKWENHKTSQTDLLSFSGKVEGKAQWSRGVFISYSGFTDDGLEAFARGKSTRIICMDGFDMHCVLSRGLNLGEVINRKMRRAGETNQAYVSVRDLFPSLTF